MSALSLISDGFLDRGHRPALALLVGGLLVDLEAAADPWSLGLPIFAIAAEARSLLASTDAVSAAATADAMAAPGPADTRSVLASSDAQSRPVRLQ